MTYASRIQEKKLSSGARVLVSRFPVRGMVSLAGSIAGGKAYCGSEEFADIHAEMLLQGTSARSKQDLQIALDAMGASLSFSAGYDRLSFLARVPRKHLEELLKLIAEVLREPSFPEDELGALKQREAAALALEAQDTKTQAGIALSRLLYAKGHPNRQDSTDESRAALARVTAKALRNYHAKHLDASSLILSLSGDIEAQASSLAEKHFKGLPLKHLQAQRFKAGKSAPRKAAAVPIEHKSNIDYMLGIATGITKKHRDYAPLMLGLQVLGFPGGFTGRLMSIVREQEGLTYGVYAYASGFRNTVDGAALVWSGFAAQLFAKGRASIMREIRRVAAEGIGEEELRKHQERFIAGSKVRLSNSGAFAQAAHDLAAEGEKLSYLDEFPKKVAALTSKEVNRVLKKYLIPRKFSEAAAGPVGKNDLTPSA